MADPVTLTAITLATTAASAGMQAYGHMQSGAASKQMALYQAQVAEQNAQIARENAAHARHVGELEAQRSGIKSRFNIGQALATQGKSGLDVNVGSPVQVRESMGKVAEYEQATIRANAARQAYGQEVQAMEKTAASTLYKMGGEKAETASYIDAASSILGGASSVSGKWLQASQMGVLGGTKGTSSSGSSLSSTYFG